MSNFVLVSGSWSGGYAWCGVAPRLRRAGHLVCTPSSMWVDKVTGSARVVSLNGEVAQEGHVLSDGWTEEAQAHYRTVLEEAKRSGWITPPPALTSIADPVLNRWVLERARPQPVGTYTEPYPAHGSARYQVPHTYLRCGTREGEEPVATALRTDPRWSFRELASVNHLGLIYAIDVIANALLDLAA